MNAEEMFAELGFKRADKSEKYITYEFDGQKISFCTTDKLFLNDYVLHGKLLDACVQQFKELGWIE